MMIEVVNESSTEANHLCTFPENSETDSIVVENTDTVIDEVPVETLDFGTSEQVVISAAELISRQVEYIPCLVEPILHKTGLACIAGSSDTGKSSFLRYLSICVVSGKSDFLGFPIHAEHRRAIYVSTEDDDMAIAYLLRKQNEHLQEDVANLEGLHFIFKTENLLQTVDDELTKQPADIVCIDAFTDIYVGGMNESNRVRNFLNDYSQLGHKHKCLMMFLHHCGKRTEELAPSKHNLLGSQAFEAKMRLVMELRNDVAEEKLKHLCIVKGNYLPASEKSESYQLLFTDNLTFINTGERKSFGSLTKTAVTKKQELEQEKENEQVRQNKLFEVMFSDGEMSYTDLYNSIVDTDEVSVRTAKRRIKAATDAGIIIKTEDGSYYYPKAVTDEVENPFDDEVPLEEEFLEEEQEPDIEGNV